MTADDVRVNAMSPQCSEMRAEGFAGVYDITTHSLYSSTVSMTDHVVSDQAGNYVVLKWSSSTSQQEFPPDVTKHLQVRFIKAMALLKY